MKTVNVPFAWGNIIVFDNFLYNYESGIVYNIPYSMYKTALQHAEIFYYKVTSNIPSEYGGSIDNIIESVRNNDFLLSVTNENHNLVDLDMEEHDLILQLDGYVRYSNALCV